MSEKISYRGRPPKEILRDLPDTNENKKNLTHQLNVLRNVPAERQHIANEFLTPLHSIIQYEAGDSDLGEEEIKEFRNMVDIGVKAVEQNNWDALKGMVSLDHARGE